MRVPLLLLLLLLLLPLLPLPLPLPLPLLLLLLLRPRLPPLAAMPRPPVVRDEALSLDKVLLKEPNGSSAEVRRLPLLLRTRKCGAVLQALGIAKIAIGANGCQLPLW